jgi:hypothetical protein
MPRDSICICKIQKASAQLLVANLQPLQQRLLLTLKPLESVPSSCSWLRWSSGLQLLRVRSLAVQAIGA